MLVSCQCKRATERLNENHWRIQKLYKMSFHIFSQWEYLFCEQMNTKLFIQSFFYFWTCTCVCSLWKIVHVWVKNVLKPEMNYWVGQLGKVPDSKPWAWLTLLPHSGMVWSSMPTKPRKSLAEVGAISTVNFVMQVNLISVQFIDRNQQKRDVWWIMMTDHYSCVQPVCPQHE